MHFPILCLAPVFLCSVAVATLLQDRQVPPGNSSISTLIGDCAPNPFTVGQFTTFSGSNTSAPQIAFFLTNQNGVAVGGEPRAPFFCKVTLPMYSHIRDDNAVWSCENGTGFKFNTNSVLTVSQSMICDALWEGAPIWTLANGTIDTTAGWDANGGVYNTSTEPENSLEVFDIMQSVPTSVPDLPACGQMCVNAELSLSPSFGCSPRNATCLCGSFPFNTAFRNCLLGCDSPAETQESADFWDVYCSEGGVRPATPAPITPSDPDCGTGSACL